MNEFEFPAHEYIDQEALERLADGELSDAAYRDLLARMDEALARGSGEPWRRCALAMLEAQALRRELKAFVGWAPRGETVSVQSNASKGRKRGLRWTGTALACVASFAAAFVLAAVLKGVWMGPSAPLEIDGAAQYSADANPKRSFQTAPQIVQTPDNAGDASDRAPTWEAAGNLTLALNTGDEGEEQRVEVPLYYVADGDIPAEWTNSSAAPPALLEALEKAGHRVTRRQRFWPLKLDDGREVIVPIEQLVVAPATAESFQ